MQKEFVITFLTILCVSCNSYAKSSLSYSVKDSMFYLNYVHWNYNTAKINPASIQTLESIKEYLDKYKNTKIYFRVLEHPNIETSAYYVFDKAKSLTKYFINKGINKERVFAKGVLIKEKNDYNFNIIGLEKDEIIKRHKLGIPIIEVTIKR